ncbi:MAG: hypothetical protein Q9209_000964 [Squamulea sp. 1 TL-2023]
MAIPNDLPEKRSCTDSSDVDYSDLETERLHDSSESPSSKRKHSEIASDTLHWRNGRNPDRPYGDGKTSPSLLNHLVPASKARNDVDAWEMWPVIQPVYCGYNIRWSFNHLPFPIDQARQTVQSLHPETRSAVEERLETISAKEREFLKAFVQGRLPNGSGVAEVNAAHQSQHVGILNIIVKQGQAMNGGFDEIGNRRITIITQVNQSQRRLRLRRLASRIPTHNEEFDELFERSKLDPGHAIEANTNILARSSGYAARTMGSGAETCTYDFHPQSQQIRQNPPKGSLCQPAQSMPKISVTLRYINPITTRKTQDPRRATYRSIDYYNLDISHEKD